MQGEQPLPGAHEIAQLGVRQGEKRKPDEVTLGRQVGDPEGVLGVGLQREVVGDLFPPFGVARQHRDDREPLLVLVVGKGEPVIAGELEADEDLRRRCPATPGVDEGDGVVKARPGRGDRQRAGVGPAARAHHEGVVVLPGIDPDDGPRLGGARPLGQMGHGPSPAGRGAVRLPREAWAEAGQRITMLCTRQDGED
jgi:hypothetical protein